MERIREWVRDRRVVGAIAAAGATLVLASPAYCDDLPGLAMFIITLWLSVEIVITIAEALVYHRVLGLSGWRALGTSVVANVASIVAGQCIAPFAIVSGDVPSILLGATVTVAVEPPVVACLNRRYPNMRRLYTVAIVTNVCTYAAGIALLYLPCLAAWAGSLR